MALNTTNASKTKKEIESVSERIKKSKIKFSDIVIPMLVVVILVILGVFVFVPMIKAATASQNEYHAVLEKEKQLKAIETALNKMDEATLQVDLINAKKVIPNTLKVSSFVYYIDNLAESKSLKSDKLSAGDIKISTKGETNQGKFILGVSGPLEYSGSYEQILDFLNSLYSASPYIISIENIDLEKTANSWDAKLNVTGYYVPENTVSVNLYSQFTPYTQYTDIIKIFEVKASKLD